jgi:hypothetical protein
MSTPNQITNIEHAKAFKRMGVPLNTPVIERELSDAYSHRWARLQGAKVQFSNAAHAYLLKCIERKKPSPSEWGKVLRKFKALRKECWICDHFIDPENPTGHPNDEECTLLAVFMFQRAWPYLNFWQDIIERLESGESVPFNVDDMPKWFDPE